MLHTHVRLKLLKRPVDGTLRENGGEGGIHLLPSDPISVLTTVIPMVAGIEFDVKGVFVSTVSTPAMAHLNSSIKGPLHT